MCAVKSQRAYNSPLRVEQAQETRRRIIEGARDLFVENGYPPTTIAAVARRAGVSADTIYSGFGTKIALLKEVLDTVVSGDDAPVPVLERTGPQAMREETDQRRQIEMFAHGIAEQLERVRPLDDVLRSAAAVDPAAADLRSDMQVDQRKKAMTTVVRWIAARGALRAGLKIQDAASIVWTLTSPDVHRLLRDDCSWSRAHYERWLRDTLVESLLPQTVERH